MSSFHFPVESFPNTDRFLFVLAGHNWGRDLVDHNNYE